MLLRKRDAVYQARAATAGDAAPVQRLIAQAQRIYLRTAPEEVMLDFRPGWGWVTGKGDNLTGLMLAEIQPPGIAVITAAALSDDWRVPAYLDAFLPLVETTMRSRGVTALAQIGHAPWLTVALRERGFVSRDWVVTYEWHYQPVAIGGHGGVTVRSAHRRDVPILVSLDEQIFGPLWHKPLTTFEEALARAFIFAVAELDGQIIGYQWCEKHERHGHITRLGVRPGWEGQGVGTRLLTQVLVAMVKAGVNWVTLNTQESNLRSRMLYERHGFRPLNDERVAVLWKDM